MGKLIVITGAGTGFGRAMARRLAADGHRLVLLGRRLGKVREVAQELGAGSLALACDVADPDSVDAAFAQIADREPRVDVLINNAGVFDPFLIEDATNDQIRTALDTNLAGPIYCSRAAIPLLAEGSHIINIGSETVVEPIAMLSLYQSSKAGLERFTQTLKQELAPRGIRVTMLRAGKMIGPELNSTFDPAVARRFAEENQKLGVDNRKAAISKYDSVAELIPWLIALPADVHIPQLMVEARHA